MTTTGEVEESTGIMSEQKIEIESGIPMPEKRKASGRFPWNEMDVGDSFIVPVGEIRAISD